MIYKQEAIDVLEVYRRNVEHILGDENELVKVIQTCINLVDELEDTKWIPVTEGLPKVDKPCGEMVSSESVLCIDSEGNYVVCRLWDDGIFCDGYGERRDVVKWMPIPKEEKE